MTQPVSPDEYAALALPDQWIEDTMQAVQCRILSERLQNCLTVLELGYGAGIVTRALVGAGKQVTTVDGSESLALKAALDGAAGVHAMFEEFDTNVKHDAVIASFILEHIADPLALLKRARQWSNRLIVVVGNAESYHRQLAVHMGLQPRLDTLSARDHAVGHLRVYSWETIFGELWKAGWKVTGEQGIMFKPLPNSMLAKLPPEVVSAMCELPIRFKYAANILLDCEAR